MSAPGLPLAIRPLPGARCAYRRRCREPTTGRGIAAVAVAAATAAIMLRSSTTTVQVELPDADQVRQNVPVLQRATFCGRAINWWRGPNIIGTWCGHPA